MAVVLTLGSVVFSDFEIPESINFGGSQMLSITKLVGGDRVIDAMGRDDDDIHWSGRFRGATAEGRAAVLDGLRISGAEVLLAWSSRRYRVVLHEFKADFQQAYEIPYQISCCVLEDMSLPVLALDPSVDQAVTQDVGATVGLNISIVSVASSISAVSASLSGAPSLQLATAQQIAGIQTAMQASLTTINGEIAPRNTLLAGQTSVGGLVAGVSPVAGASALLAQTNALAELTGLYQAKALMGRASVNVASGF